MNRASLGINIREAVPDDAEAIAAIYNQGIEDRVATLETQLRTADERAQWLAAKGPRHPVLVALDGEGSVVGWGSLNQFNPRPAYDHVVEFSVYVGREQRGQGIGSVLLSALEDRARSLGFHKMVLAAFPWNAGGMRLYQKHGFATVGTFHEQGRLDGEGSVVGWGSLNQFNPRPAYDHVVEFSVYVGREQRGRGIGGVLLSALEDRARSLGYHKMVLAAFPWNAGGMRLYQKHGFTTVGTYHEQGRLDGRWVDVILMEKILG